MQYILPAKQSVRIIEAIMLTARREATFKRPFL